MEKLLACRNFPDDSLLLVGNAQTTGDNPITHQYSAFFITFVVESAGTIIECSASVVLPLTDRFIRDLFIGRHIADDEKAITADVYARYYASSRKAIVVAYRDALKKFKEIKAERQ